MSLKITSKIPRKVAYSSALNLLEVYTPQITLLQQKSSTGNLQASQDLISTINARDTVLKSLGYSLNPKGKLTTFRPPSPEQTALKTLTLLSGNGDLNAARELAALMNNQSS